MTMPRRDVLRPDPVLSDWRTVVDRACWSKRRHDDPADAHRHLRFLHDPTMRVYRCPFADGAPHFHVGHVPSVDEVRRIAVAIRARATELAVSA